MCAQKSCLPVHPPMCQPHLNRQTRSTLWSAKVHASSVSWVIHSRRTKLYKPLQVANHHGERNTLSKMRQ
jgi:hypothetical protein